MFFWNSLAFRWSSGCWQFDLSFLCLFKNQLEHLEFYGSHIAEAWLGEFSALLCWHVRWVQLYGSLNIPDVQAGLEKAEEPEIKLPASAGSSKKQKSSRKTSISALLTMPKPLTVWITINCGKFWKRWEYQTTWPASWETYMQVRKQQLELNVEQQTGCK